MTDNNKELEIRELEDVTGGVFHQNIPSTHGNICPRCRSPKHHVIRTEKMDELRKCDQCQLEYYYRKW